MTQKSGANGNAWLRLWPLAILFFLTNSFFLAFFYLTLSPGRQTAVEIHVPKGATLRDISNILVEKGAVRYRLTFELLSKARGLDKDLRAGHYVIPPGTVPWEAISILTTGTGEQIRLTVPEGLTNKQVFQRISNTIAGLDPDMLARLAISGSFIREIGLDAPTLMGYLFPDTYFVPPTIDERGILRVMTERFDQVYNELARDHQLNKGLTRHEIVILASIVEKEAVSDRERPVISSVFLNRLSLKRPLESCATVLFVLGKHKSRLLYRDLEVDSPYNTYLHTGLTPGPICNPGRASLKAAIFPSDTNYLYFVARGDGTHVFSRSLTDHNRAKKRIKR